MKSEEEMSAIDFQKVEDEAMLAQARFNSFLNDDDFMDEVFEYVGKNKINEPKWWSRFRERI